MMKKYFYFCVYTLLVSVRSLSDAPAASEEVPLYADDFSGDLSNWVVEQTKGTTRIHEGALRINDMAGATVWFKHKLSGPVAIEFDVTLIEAGGANDRVSDLNCFWMATDPENPDNLFYPDHKRNGKFRRYHPLRLYYVGFGGNNNRTTRFRRYPGDGSRPLLPEHDLSGKPYRNIANKTSRIRIVSNGGQVQYIKDGKIIFDFQDDEPLEEGWFGFRTVRNHMSIDNFHVTQLAKATTPGTRPASPPQNRHMSQNAWGSHYAFHQRAHFDNGKTFLTWAGTGNHPYVAAYDHDQAQWSEAVRVGTNKIPENDYHGNPSILVDLEGYLHVFYGGHSREMRYSRSRKPYRLDEWDDMTSTLPYTQSTYPQLFVMSDGTIYAFYRRKTHRGHWTYITSNDHGATWSKEHFVLDGGSPPGRGWYTSFFKDPARDRIHVVFLWHASKKNESQNSRRNLYHLYMDHGEPDWFTMKGTPLSTPVSFHDANQNAMIFDSQNKFNNIARVSVTPDGRPVAINQVATETARRENHLHVWTGETWRTQTVPVRSLLQPETDEWVGFSEAEGEVQRYVSTNEGRTWQKKETVLKVRQGVSINTRIANAHPDANVVIFENYKNKNRPGKQRVWVWGVSGFLENEQALSQPGTQ